MTFNQTEIENIVRVIGDRVDPIIAVQTAAMLVLLVVRNKDVWSFLRL
jgi:hypothetical protein